MRKRIANIFVRFTNHVRAALAVVVGVIILAITSLGAGLLSPLKLLSLLGAQNPVPFFCGIGFRTFDLVVLRLILGVKLDRRTKVRKAEDNEVVIIIANHPPLSLMFGTPSLMGWNLGLRGYAAVIKSEFVRDPKLSWLGIPAMLAGFALPIDRDNREGAMRSLARHTRRLPFGKQPFGVIIFPDGTRLTKDKAHKSWNKYLSKTGNPYRFRKFTHVLVPKPGGLFQLVQTLNASGYTIRVVDITIGLNRRHEDTFWGELTGMCNAKVYVHQEEITSLVLETKTLRQLNDVLLRRWMEKNRKLREVETWA